MAFPYVIRINNSKFILEHKQLKGIQKILSFPNNFKKKSKTEDTKLLDFKIYYKVTVIKIAWNWQENRQIETSAPRNETISIWAIHL